MFAFVAAAAFGAQEFAIEPRFERAGLFHDGIAPVKVDERWGFIDISGKLVVMPRYQGILRGNNGRFGVRDGGRWGYLSTNGNLVIKPRFEEARPFANGLAAVRSKGLWGYIAPDGNYALPPAFTQVTAMGSNFSLVVRDDSLFVCDRFGGGLSNGTLIKVEDPLASGAPKDWTLQEMSEGRAVLKVRGERLFVTEYGVAYGPYEVARPYSEGLAAVRIDSRRWIFIQKNGHWAFARSFEGARDFKQGVAPVRLNGKWGYIDKWGRIVLESAYDDAYSFSDGYAVIRNGKKRGFLEMDDKGKISVYVPPRFEDVYRFSEGLAPVRIDGKWGYLASRHWPQSQRTRGIVDLKP